jgi:oxygen-independent coproporphyrinogen-3 oxidase
METILQTIDACFSLAENAEISIEANPGTIVDQSLKAYSALGVNRISFGMQSSREEELKLLGRIHTHADTVNSVEIARRAGFNNLNLDLIYNLPGQTMQNWQENLQAVLDLSPEHISLYALGIEEGTLLHQQIEEGFLPYPEDDQAADMVQYAVEMLDQMGYQHYEISNWAKIDSDRDYRCRHNLQYWQNDPYFGFGAGAHGLVENIRTVNEPTPSKYITACLQNEPTAFPLGPAAIESNKRSRKEQIEDHMILNLRLLQQGVERKEFLERFRAELLDIYPQVIAELVQDKHLE